MYVRVAAAALGVCLGAVAWPLVDQAERAAAEPAASARFASLDVVAQGRYRLPAQGCAKPVIEFRLRSREDAAYLGSAVVRRERSGTVVGRVPELTLATNRWQRIPVRVCVAGQFQLTVRAKPDSSSVTLEASDRFVVTDGTRAVTFR